MNHVPEDIFFIEAAVNAQILFLDILLKYLLMFKGVPNPSSRICPEVYSASNRNEYQKHKNNVSGEKILPMVRRTLFCSRCKFSR
jgi:hypothetical protein